MIRPFETLLPPPAESIGVAYLSPLVAFPAVTRPAPATAASTFTGS